MNTRIASTGIVVCAALSIAIGAFIYPALPNQVASHWNLAGVADGTMNKFWAIFFLPALMLLFLGLMHLLPRIDPMHKDITEFRGAYNSFWFLLSVFMLYIFLLMVAWNIGWRFNFGIALAPALAALFFFTGVLLRHVHRNWFVGIRTPWTMHSDQVWDKTHLLGGKLFALCAVLILVGMFFPSLLLWFILGPLCITVAVLVVYSYIEFRRETQ